MAIRIGGSKRVDRNTSPTTVQLIDSTTTPSVQPVGRAGYTLAFSDEFNGSTLDRLKWDPWYPDTAFWNAPEQGYPGHKTNTGEPQVYDPSGITVSGGNMVFTMRNEASVPAPYASQWPYTSGMVTSYPSFNPTYGFFEARMKLNNSAGIWPAFWMDRTDQVWPPEIDWMELGLYGPTTVSHAYHYPAGGYTVDQNAVSDPTDWHTYGGEWRSGSIKCYIDGTETWSFSDARVTNQPMYLICNLAGLSSSPPSAGSLPQSIQIDYIRAWA